MNYSKKKTIILLIFITIGLTGLTIYQFTVIEDLREIQDLYAQKTENIFAYLLRDSSTTIDIAAVLDSLGNPNSNRELWQDLDLIKKADKNLNKWEREMIQLIVVADEKNISLDNYKSIGYEYGYVTHWAKVSSEKQIEVANKVFSNNLGNIIVTLLYFVDPPRLTPETRDYFKKVAIEFQEFNTEIDGFKNRNMYFSEKDLPHIKVRLLDILENHIENVNSLSSDFSKVLEPRIIKPNNN